MGSLIPNTTICSDAGRDRFNRYTAQKTYQKMPWLTPYVSPRHKRAQRQLLAVTVGLGLAVITAAAMGQKYFELRDVFSPARAIPSPSLPAKILAQN